MAGLHAKCMFTLVRAGQFVQQLSHLTFPPAKRSRFSTYSPAFCVIATFSFSCNRCCCFIMVLAHTSLVASHVDTFSYAFLLSVCSLLNASSCLYVFAKGTVTKYQGLDSFSNQFFCNSGDQKPQIKVLVGSVSPGAPLLGLQDAAFSLSSHRLSCVCPDFLVL